MVICYIQTDSRSRCPHSGAAGTSIVTVVGGRKYGIVRRLSGVGPSASSFRRPLSLCGAVVNKIGEILRESHGRTYDCSSRHPAFEALEERAGLAEVIAGHVTATFACLCVPELRYT